MMNKPTHVFGVLGVALILWGCETTDTAIIEENPAVYQILTAAQSAARSAGSLSAATDAALDAVDIAVRARREAEYKGDFSLARRAESIAAANIRAVNVTITETATRADALVGAAGDIPNRYELVLLSSIGVVSQFSNGIAEKNDELNSSATKWSIATRNVFERVNDVEEAVNRFRNNAKENSENDPVNALGFADVISDARGAHDDALSEVIRADQLLTEILRDIQQDANNLQNAAINIERQLPADLAPRRSIE